MSSSSSTPARGDRTCVRFLRLSLNFPRWRYLSCHSAIWTSRRESYTDPDPGIAGLFQRLDEVLPEDHGSWLKAPAEGPKQSSAPNDFEAAPDRDHCCPNRRYSRYTTMESLVWRGEFYHAKAVKPSYMGPGPLGKQTCAHGSHSQLPRQELGLCSGLSTLSSFNLHRPYYQLQC